MSLETNLWGELPKPEILRTPLVILREQAALLGEMTNRILEADVGLHKASVDYSKSAVELASLEVTRKGREFIADLDIVAPFLDHYRVTIAQIKFDLAEVYPVELIDVLAMMNYKANNEAEFVRKLQGILRSEKVQRVISSLLAQVRQ
jgi:hypothetical protein